MKNQTEQNLSNAAPAQQERTITNMTTKIFSKKWVGVAVAVCLLIIIAFVGFSFYNRNYIADSLIYIDVNPSVEMKINKNNNVLDVIPTNPDGVTILDGMNLKNTELKVAVNAIMGSMVQKGYFVDGENGILVTIQNDDVTKTTNLRNVILSDIDVSLSTNNVAALVINQTLKDTSDAKKFAESNNISIGKAGFVLNLAEKDSTLDTTELAKMSIENIAALVTEKSIDTSDIVYYDAGDSNGGNVAGTIENIDEIQQSSTDNQVADGANANTAKITVEKAKEIALKDAGIEAAKATFIKEKLDYDDGKQVYEVEFYSGNIEYDYEIDANTGAIVSVDKDIEDYTIPSNNQTTGSGSTNTAKITVEKAKEIALKDAGIEAAKATFIKEKLDYDDGKQVYEVEFYSGNIEYDYEIDANTGAIVSVDKDIEDYTIPSNNQATDSANTNTAKITVEKAKEIALKDAGIEAAKATFIKEKLDYDDGKQVYEVEFYSGNIEYDYEIDANTGAIVSVDKDIENYTIPSNNQATGSGNTNTAKITEAKAKEIALNHAGIAAASATLMKAKLDYEDGIQVYEIEFYSGSMEYDYEINADTGAVISYKSETND